MELDALWRTVKRRLWVVLLMAVIAGGSAASLCRWYLPKVYDAQATLMVIPSSTTQTSYISTLVAGQQMVSTYAALASSPLMLSDALALGSWDMSPARLAKLVTAVPETGTNLMTLSVKAHSPQAASGIANALATTLTSTISQVTGQPSLKVVEGAVENPIPVSPRPTRTTALAAALGIVMGILVTLIWNALDDSIRQEEELTQVLKIPVLGVIGSISDPSPKTVQRQAAGHPRRSLSS